MYRESDNLLGVLLQQVSSFANYMERSELFAHFEFASDPSLLLEDSESVQDVIMRHLLQKFPWLSSIDDGKLGSQFSCFPLIYSLNSSGTLEAHGDNGRYDSISEVTAQRQSPRRSDSDQSAERASKPSLKKCTKACSFLYRHHGYPVMTPLKKPTICAEFTVLFENLNNEKQTNRNTNNEATHSSVSKGTPAGPRPAAKATSTRMVPYALKFSETTRTNLQGKRRRRRRKLFHSHNFWSLMLSGLSEHLHGIDAVPAKNEHA